MTGPTRMPSTDISSGPTLSDPPEATLLKDASESEATLIYSKESSSYGSLFYEETGRLFHVALPSVAIQFNLYAIFPMSASWVGRGVGTEALAAFSLCSMVGNLTCLSVIIGALTAADTLMPRAYGSQRYEELGRLALRGWAVSLLLLALPVFTLSHVSWMTGLMEQLGQPPVVAALAARWIPIYLCGLPANLTYRVIQRFLVAQHQPWLPVYASLLPTFVCHPIFLHILIPLYGLNGSALAVVMTQWLMLIILLGFLYCWPVYEPTSWPGWSWSYIKEALDPIPMAKFMHLGLGGILSYTEWTFWEVMCFIAGSFGVVPLCAHTMAYNVIPTLFMIPLGLSIGLSVRMGIHLARDYRRAETVAAGTMLFTIVVAVINATLLYSFRRPVMHMFTHDPQVIAQAEEIWGDVCIYIVFLYIYGINGGIMRALGLQWRMAAVLVTVLWLLTLPSIFWFAVRKGGRLTVQWRLLPCFYALMQVALILNYATIDLRQKTINIRMSIASKVGAPITPAITPEDMLAVSEATALLAAELHV